MPAGAVALDRRLGNQRPRQPLRRAGLPQHLGTSTNLPRRTTRTSPLDSPSEGRIPRKRERQARDLASPHRRPVAGPVQLTRLRRRHGTRTATVTAATLRQFQKRGLPLHRRQGGLLPRQRSRRLRGHRLRRNRSHRPGGWRAQRRSSLDHRRCLPLPVLFRLHQRLAAQLPKRSS